MSRETEERLLALVFCIGVATRGVSLYNVVGWPGPAGLLSVFAIAGSIILLGR